MANIGLFGGAFDPIHQGHVTVACHVLRFLALDEIRLIPCLQPVHKDSCLASPWQRAAMIALAIQSLPGLRLDTCELDRRTPSYAIDTLNQFIARHGSHHRLSWILGADALQDFKGWYKWRDILNLTDLVVVNRQGYDQLALQDIILEVSAVLQEGGHVLHWLDMPLQPQASRLIRTQGAQLNDLPELVSQYIEAEHIYD